MTPIKSRLALSAALGVAAVVAVAAAPAIAGELTSERAPPSVTDPDVALLDEIIGDLGDLFEDPIGTDGARQCFIDWRCCHTQSPDQPAPPSDH